MHPRTLLSMEAAAARLREISRKVALLAPEVDGEVRAKLLKIQEQSAEAVRFYESLAPKRPTRKAPELAGDVALAAFGAPLVGLVPPRFQSPKRAA